MAACSSIALEVAPHLECPEPENSRSFDFESDSDTESLDGKQIT